MAENTNNNNIFRADITSVVAAVTLDCEHEFEIDVPIPGTNLEWNGVYCPFCLNVQELSSIEPETVEVATITLTVTDDDANVKAATGVVEYNIATGNFSGFINVETLDDNCADTDDCALNCSTIDQVISDLEETWADLVADDGGEDDEYEEDEYEDE
jgi:hypothetical protein